MSKNQTAPEPSEFVRTILPHSDKRLEWIREHLGEETYEHALELKQFREKLRRRLNEPPPANREPESPRTRA